MRQRKDMMADKLIIDNRTGKSTEYLLAHLGVLLMLGKEGRVHGSSLEFPDGVTIHVIGNEKSVRLLIVAQASEA